MSRRPFICGNWKMHCAGAEARALVERIGKALPPPRAADVVVAPPFTALETVGPLVRELDLGLAAQDVHWEPRGAFTGEVSAAMLADLGCRHGIVGHSERRSLFHETDENVARKVRALLGGGIAPIVCVGETLEERDGGKTLARVLGQLDAALDGLGTDEFRQVTVAYEPVWAIGTGRNATPAQAQEVHAAIRKRLVERQGALANGTRILYGGSVKPDNAPQLLREPDVDGALVGGASLDASSFAAIVQAAG